MKKKIRKKPNHVWVIMATKPANPTKRKEIFLLQGRSTKAEMVKLMKSLYGGKPRMFSTIHKRGLVVERRTMTWFRKEGRAREHVYTDV